MSIRDQLRAAIGTTDASEGLPHWHTVIDTPDQKPRHSVYVERQAVLDAIDAIFGTLPSSNDRLLDLADRIRQHTAGAGADLETVDFLADRAAEGPPIERLRGHLRAIDNALSAALDTSAAGAPR